MNSQHVIFGTGAIGRAVADELIRRGEPVRMVNRSGTMAERPDGVEVVAADLFDPENVRRVTDGARVVYQCAQPPYTQWKEKFPPFQAAIIDGLTGSGAKLVLVENLYLYGDTDGQPIHEGLPYEAETRKGRARAKIAKEALQAHREGKVRIAQCRGSDYFGPWGVNSSMGERAIGALVRGKPAQLLGRADLPHTYTYTRDFGKAMVVLGERDEADGQAWHVPNDRPRITQGELVAMLADEAGVEPEYNTMGKLMMRLGGLFIPEARESVEMMYEFEKPFVVDSSKFEDTFGMKATHIEEAIRETVAWYQTLTEVAHAG